VAPRRDGQLGGFDITSTARRFLATREVVIILDGAPEAEIRLSPDELADTDPAKLVIRLENRLHGLEAVKAKGLKETGDLKAEAARAREDLGKHFPSAGQLTEARERVARLDRQLAEAARPQHEEPASSRAATTPAIPEPVSIAGRNFPDRQPIASQNPGPSASISGPASERGARPSVSPRP
jgi:hypothetical protein